MKNKNFLISIGTLLTVIIFIIIWGINTRNNLIIKDELIKNKWAKVESAYQRRLDLIPNLLIIVKGYAQHEKETLISVTEARARATQIKIDPSKLTPEMIRKFQQIQDNLSLSLNRLLVSIERYPELKANQNFLTLQSELAGTENRIKIERDQFNDAVMDYNKSVRIFPGYIIAHQFGFLEKIPFKANLGAENSPKFKF